MTDKNVVLIIPNEILLKGIGGIFFQHGFTVFPFHQVDEIPDSLFEEKNLFVWDIEEVKPDNLEWIEQLRASKMIKFILVDFLSDYHLLHLLETKILQSEIYSQSYKVRDLVQMSEMLFQKNSPFVNLSSYVEKSGRIYAQEINNSKNYLEDAERLVHSFLKDNHLEKNIHDIDIFFLALGEVVENFVEHQLVRLKKKPSIIIEYGVDKEKILISVRDELGEADFNSLFQSFVRKTSIKQKIDLDNYSDDGIYMGSRGRGMAIIKKGVHRLISIVKKEPDEYLDKRTQFIFTLYLDKKPTEQNASVNMLVFF